MCALLSLLCLLWGSPPECVSSEHEEACLDQRAEYRAILSEISAGRAAEAPPRDLPEDLREAVEAWTAMS